ncbi:unnamed protein product [Caretta caretta]
MNRSKFTTFIEHLSVEHCKVFHGIIAEGQSSQSRQSSTGKPDAGEGTSADTIETLRGSSSTCTECQREEDLG